MWGRDQNPDLGNFPRLHGVPDFEGFAKEESSGRLNDYRTTDVHLGPDGFLDMVKMLAHDQANPSEVPNPPARILTALAREEFRQRRLYMKRWGQAPKENAEDFFEANLAAQDHKPVHEVESEEIAKVELKRLLAELKLPTDQARVLQAKIKGLDLQGSRAAEQLGWTNARLARVRRSLEPDRKWGKRLLRHFGAYNPLEPPK